MYEFGGRRSLQIGLNILGEPCGGCQYESYPYKARLPIRVDGKYPTKEFTCDKDVWDVIELLIEEVNDVNQEKGKEFDVLSSINSQLPFFGCRNIFFDRIIQKDIQRYLYCEKFGTSPYEGDYGQQPCLWVDKANIIRNTFAKLEKTNIDKAKKNG
tara:strand:+ start:379 stop:846 length:468 start_codon:yes stop_codon:yes gene_type:complete